MIAYLHGALHSVRGQWVVLDVHGVGYELLVPAATARRMPAPGGTVALEVSTHVREDAIQLFGFDSGREKNIFERLIGVAGVGPKLALAMLSGLALDDLIAAIRGGDLARLTGIPGVGRKTAERVSMELRDKIEPGAAPASAAGAAADAVSALINLGYAPALAEKTVAQAASRKPDAGFEPLFTECLRIIGR